LGIAATSGLYWIGNFDSLHASPRDRGTRNYSATIRKISANR
jgi:hypothetical protein